MGVRDGSHFDHVAIAAQSWDDAFPCFVETLGGRWTVSGDGGDFQPLQFKFASGPKIEILQPGARPDGFLQRFLDQNGPSPHHLTFRVADIDRFAAACEAVEFATFPGLEFPEHGHRELFVHPKASGLGTLVQAITLGLDYEGRGGPPPGLPAASGNPHVVEWVAWAVPDVARTADFLVAATGAVVGEVDPEGGWTALEWRGGNRMLLVADGEAPGVHHVMFRAPDQPAPEPPRALAGIAGADIVLGTRLLFAGLLA